MLKLDVLEGTGDRPKNAARTVPVQYRFNPDKYTEMKSKGFRVEFKYISLCTIENIHPKE